MPDRNKTNEGQKRVSCEKCGLSCAVSTIRRHKCDMFTCSICGKKYVFKQDHDLHFRTHDENYKPIQCGCGRTYSRNSGLKRHQQRSGCMIDVEVLLNIEICSPEEMAAEENSQFMNMPNSPISAPEETLYADTSQFTIMSNSPTSAPEETSDGDNSQFMTLPNSPSLAPEATSDEET